MEDLIIACIMIAIACGIGYFGHKAKIEQKNWRESEADRFVEIKFSNGFIIIRNDEQVRWNGLSQKEKEGFFNDQQKLLKLGIIKIISSNGQKRLVRKEEVDARKKIEKKWQEIKKK